MFGSLIDVINIAFSRKLLSFSLTVTFLSININLNRKTNFVIFLFLIFDLKQSISIKDGFLLKWIFYSILDLKLLKVDIQNFQNFKAKKRRAQKASGDADDIIPLSWLYLFANKGLQFRAMTT